jgi:hypothetical protein
MQDIEIIASSCPNRVCGGSWTRNCILSEATPHLPVVPLQATAEPTVRCNNNANQGYAKHSQNRNKQSSSHWHNFSFVRIHMFVGYACKIFFMQDRVLARVLQSEQASVQRRKSKDTRDKEENKRMEEATQNIKGWKRPHRKYKWQHKKRERDAH